MGKNIEKIWEEVRNFKSLSSVEQQKKLENLGQQKNSIKVEISTNAAAIKKAEKDLERAKAKSEAIGKEYAEAREKRQNAVALGEDDKKFKISTSDLMTEQDLIEDYCIGLERRIENLRAEGDLLEQEKTEIEKTILRFRLVPLVARYNEVGKELVGILEQIMILAIQLREGFHEFRSGAQTVFYSSWEGIDRVAKFFVGEEINDPKNLWPNGKPRDLFNSKEFYERIRQEREKAAEVSQKKIEEGAVA